MAIVQISRITQRKGLEQDLPQPLAGAELGWAVDQRKLYIGNGTIEDGAPIVGNTEILTEFSDILDYTNQYIYKGEAGGYTVQTGATAGTPVSQSLQSRLDSYAVVTDFGAIGDGVTDNTAAINRALYELYCRDTNPSVRRSLFFPAGRYLITDTLLIPPYALLYGEGGNSTIIDLSIQEWDTLQSYQTGVLVVITTGAGPYTYAYYRSNIAVPAGTAIGALAPNGDPYWDNTATLPAYIARTADSLQQTDAQIETLGAVPPSNAHINNMRFETNRIVNGFLFEQCSQCSLESVTFGGPLSETDLQLQTDNIAAVRFASTVSNVCAQIIINACEASGFTFGIETDQDTAGVTVSNNLFDTLHQGIVLDTDPTGFRIMHNTFDTIYTQGIIMTGCSLNASGYNIFYDVGNHFNGTSIPASSIIKIDTANNISIGDMFSRTDVQATQFPRIELYNSTTGLVPASIAIDNSKELILGSYIRETGINDDIIAATTNAVLFTVTVGDRLSNPLGVRAFAMNYTIARGTAVRTGVMTVTSIPDDSTGEFSWTDDFSENASTGVTLTPTDTATTVGGSIIMYYSASAADPGGSGKIYYSLTHLN